MMISTDHVRARRRGGELEITSLKPRDRAELTSYAAHAIRLFKSAQTHKQKREELEGELADVIVSAYLTRAAEGLKKMLFDRCTFKGAEVSDVITLRAKVFGLASEMRAALPSGELLRREEVLARAAEELGVSYMHIEDDLFSDLRGAHRLQEFVPLEPSLLIDEYELAQEQAVLLKATELNLTLQCDEPSDYRAFFRQLKFRRLLCEIKPCEREEEGYEIKISGPHAIFKSVTKYGLQLAQLLPFVRRARRWRLHAKVQWGKDKHTLLDFYSEGERQELTCEEGDLPDEVVSLLKQLKKSKSEWRARRASKLIHLPEQGAVCVPDLIFSHPEHAHRVYLEVLGYWSREAVWRRVEWAEQLSEPVIFAVSSRLRVSEQALPKELPSALLVYKGAITVSSLTKLLDELVARREASAQGAAQEGATSADTEGEDEGEEVELPDDADESLAGDESLIGDESLVGDESLIGEGERLAKENSEAHTEVSPDEVLKVSLSGVGLTEVGGEVPIIEPNPNAVPPEQLSLFEEEEGPGE